MNPQRYRFDTKAALAWAAAALAVWLWTDDAIATAGVGVLWLIWTALPHTAGLPVLSIALTYQWMQNVIGTYYFHVTGREPIAMVMSDYRPMVWIGIGCVATIVIGIRVAHDLLLHNRKDAEVSNARTLPWDYLIVTYAIAIVSKQAIEQFAWSITAFNQGVLALGYVRLGLFYVLLRRLVFGGRYAWATALLLLEIALGFTSFFAEFREPIMIAMVVALEHFDRRRLRDWFVATALVASSIVFGFVWMGVRAEVRYRYSEGAAPASASDRFRNFLSLASGFGSSGREDFQVTADRLVDRLWDVYYPALAVARVPSVMPHEHGALLMRALTHIVQPRFLFPDKDALESDSLLVRKYAGVFVAGPEQNTSIAFGYAVESYIDFGVPLMFLPVFVLGLFAGAGYYVLAYWIRDREVSIGATTVIFWLALAPANREWARLLGLFGTLLLFVGGAALLVDFYLRSAGTNAIEYTPSEASVPR